MSMKKSLLLLGTLLLLAVIVAACGGAPQPPAPTAAPTAPTQAPVATEAPVVVPFMDVYLASGHHNVSGEPFRHWDDATANPDGVPTACAKCHTSAGYVDFLKDGKVDNPVPAKDSQGIVCTACHSPEAMALTSVTFPSGKVVETSEEGEARCMTCHQGRESTVSVNNAIKNAGVGDNEVSDKLAFRNVHYFAAGATLLAGCTKWYRANSAAPISRK